MNPDIPFIETNLVASTGIGCQLVLSGYNGNLRGVWENVPRIPVMYSTLELDDYISGTVKLVLGVQIQSATFTCEIQVLSPVDGRFERSCIVLVNPFEEMARSTSTTTVITKVVPFAIQNLGNRKPQVRVIFRTDNEFNRVFISYLHFYNGDVHNIRYPVANTPDLEDMYASMNKMSIPDNPYYNSESSSPMHAREQRRARLYDASPSAGQMYAGQQHTNINYDIYPTQDLDLPTSNKPYPYKQARARYNSARGSSSNETSLTTSGHMPNAACCQQNNMYKIFHQNTLQPTVKESSPDTKKNVQSSELDECSESPNVYQHREQYKNSADEDYNSNRLLHHVATKPSPTSGNYGSDGKKIELIIETPQIVQGNDGTFGELSPRSTSTPRSLSRQNRRGVVYVNPLSIHLEKQKFPRRAKEENSPLPVMEFLRMNMSKSQNNSYDAYTKKNAKSPVDYINQLTATYQRSEGKENDSTLHSRSESGNKTKESINYNDFDEPEIDHCSMMRESSCKDSDRNKVAPRERVETVKRTDEPKFRNSIKSNQQNSMSNDFDFDEKKELANKQDEETDKKQSFLLSFDNADKKVIKEKSVEIDGGISLDLRNARKTDNAQKTITGALSTSLDVTNLVPALSMSSTTKRVGSAVPIYTLPQALVESSQIIRFLQASSTGPFAINLIVTENNRLVKKTKFSMLLKVSDPLLNKINTFFELPSQEKKDAFYRLVTYPEDSIILTLQPSSLTHGGCIGKRKKNNLKKEEMTIDSSLILSVQYGLYKGEQKQILDDIRSNLVELTYISGPAEEPGKSIPNQTIYLEFEKPFVARYFTAFVRIILVSLRRQLKCVPRKIIGCILWEYLSFCAFNK